MRTDSHTGISPPLGNATESSEGMRYQVCRVDNRINRQRRDVTFVYFGHVRLFLPHSKLYHNSALFVNALAVCVGD